MDKEFLNTASAVAKFNPNIKETDFLVCYTDNSTVMVNELYKSTTARVLKLVHVDKDRKFVSAIEFTDKEVMISLKKLDPKQEFGKTVIQVKTCEYKAKKFNPQMQVEVEKDELKSLRALAKIEIVHKFEIVEW